MAAAAAAAAVLNVNVGILGHVDAGKTSLARALSTTASTAAFDKSPQSQSRGITLDLGFSSFLTGVPEHLQGHGFGALQVTLVDCPGHASLIRTVMGGAQIMDMMLLVIDATKGIQTQTAECLVLGEITTHTMVVVLNKVDLFPEASRAAQIAKMTAGLQKTMAGTRFPNAPIVPVAATAAAEASGLAELVATVQRVLQLPTRKADGPFIMAADHCFAIRGQGTILTGTVLSGSVSVNQVVELPTLKLQRKVKSMQIFRQPVTTARQGDRVGVCLTQLEAELFERGLVAAPGVVQIVYGAVGRVRKVRFYKSECPSKSKFHVTIGHETVMASVQFFGTPVAADAPFDMAATYGWLDALQEPSADVDSWTWVLLQFESPVPCPPDCIFIASRLDTDLESNKCRLAFHGALVRSFTDTHYTTSVLPQLRVLKTKHRDGFVDRIVDDHYVLGRGLFKRETNMAAFIGLTVRLPSGEAGTIESPFGQSGKFKVYFPGGVPSGLAQLLAAKEPGPDGVWKPTTLRLTFKRSVFDPEKRMQPA